MRKEIHIPGIDLDYSLFHRDMDDIVRLLTQRFNGKLYDVAAPREGHLRDFVDGEHFQSLCSKLRQAAGEDAVLVPVVLSSGMLHALYMPCCVVVKLCLDMTNLARFNTLGGSNKAYPLYASIGKCTNPNPRSGGKGFLHFFKLLQVLSQRIFGIATVGRRWLLYFPSTTP